MSVKNNITITVTAQTAQAAAALQQFAAQSAGALNVLSQGGKKAADDADNAATHIRGMAYGVRSAIDGIRFAAAGGGDRALFYTADEGVRALLANGMKLSRLIPILGGIGAAAVAGAVAWHEWNAGEEEAVKKAKDLQEAWKALPPLVQQIIDMQKAGLLGPGAAANYMAMATGHKKLYLDEHGNVTEQPTRTVQEPIYSQYDPMAPPSQTGTRSVTQDNPTASAAQADKYLNDQMTANGTVSKEALAALTNLREESRKMYEEHLSGIAKDKAAMEDRYQKEQDEMEANLEVARANMSEVNFASSPWVKTAQQQLQQSKKDEQEELRQMEDKDSDERLAKITEVYNAYQKLFGDVSKDIFDVSKDQAEADKKHEEELQRQMALQQEIARGQVEGKLKGIQENPFLTDKQKAQQSIPLYRQQMGDNWNTIANLSHTAATTQDDSAALQAKEKMLALMQQQVDLQKKLDAAKGGDSFDYQMRTMVTNFQNIKSLAQDTTEIFSGGLNTAINSVASNLTRVLMGTESWHKAVLSIEQAIIGNIINAIIKAAEQWVVSEIMKYTLAEVLKESAVAGSAAVATEEALIWWTPAILSAIASAGVTADDASAQVGAAILGFAGGGRPEPGKVALVGEHGPELWVPDTAGTIVPSDRTAAMMQGHGTAQGMASKVGSNVNIHMWDHEPSAKEYLGSAQGQNHIREIVRNSRVAIGIQT